MWPSAITKLTAHLTCGLMSTLVILQAKKRVWSYMTLNGPYLRPGVIKQHKTQTHTMRHTMIVLHTMMSKFCAGLKASQYYFLKTSNLSVTLYNCTLLCCDPSLPLPVQPSSLYLYALCPCCPCSAREHMDIIIALR